MPQVLKMVVNANPPPPEWAWAVGGALLAFAVFGTLYVLIKYFR